MAKYIITNSTPLYGTVRISGSKNAALPILAACLLSDGECTIEEVPALTDVQNMCKLLKHIGATVKISKISDTIKVNASQLKNNVEDYDLVMKLRASFLLTGPILARTGRVKICLPGGCQIGTRPIDLHLKGFQAMGAKITQGHGYVDIRCRKLVGQKIYLDFPSVGATENLIMAASIANGQTILENAAIEPEIIDLANFINHMGGCIVGAGTSTIKITGVKSLKGQSHAIIPDRIEAGTFMVAAAITKGKITLQNVRTEHLKPAIAKMLEMGIMIETSSDFTSLTVSADRCPSATDIKTMPYPGFPTDMQAPFCALMSTAEGTSMIIETIFENRFMHMAELKRMGANAKIEGRIAVIEGAKTLTGAKVKATDLRAGAALVLAGLNAEGVTEIENIEHIERGYYNFENKLQSLGVNISKVMH